MKAKESKCPISGGKHDWNSHTGLCLLCGTPRNPDLHRECTGRVEEPAIAVPTSLTEEQQPPQPATGDVWLLVLADMEQRRLHGIDKYGVPLQVGNGRNHLVDAYQEALDLCVYLRQEIERQRLENPPKPPSDKPLNTAVEALRRIVESDPGPAYYIAKGALESIGEWEQ